MARLEDFANDRKNIKELPLGEAVGYIWDYYKLWIIGILFFVCFGIFLIVRITTNVPGYWFYITMVGTRAEVGTGSELWQDYIDFTGYDLTEKKVEFNAESWFDYSANRGRGNSYYEVFTGLVDAGIVDAVTMVPEDLTLFGETGRLLDLSRPECREIMEKYGDRLLYAVPLDEEYSSSPVPVGIDVSDSVLMTDYAIYTEGCALGIGANSKNIDAVMAFLDFIFGKEG